MSINGVCFGADLVSESRILDAARSRYNPAMSELAPYDSDPVLPRFLAGGPENLRLPRVAVLLLAAMAVVVSIVGQVAGADWSGPWPLDFHTAALAAATAIVTATLAARWLGRTIGVAAGVMQLSTLHALGLPRGGGWIDGWLCLLAALAMALFARANIGGRMATRMSPRVPAMFYALVGLILVNFGHWHAIGILIACFAYLLLNQDGRAFRFLIQPLGLCVFASFVGLAILLSTYFATKCPVDDQGWQSLEVVALGTLPWTPLGALAVAIGCWRGHYATSFWQFVVCCSAVPLLLTAVGAIGARSALALTSPPLAILAAAGLWDVVMWWRKRTGGR